jgi:hypothetical protein
MMDGCGKTALEVIRSYKDVLTSDATSPLNQILGFFQLPIGALLGGNEN